MATIGSVEKTFLDTYSHQDHRSLAGFCQNMSDMVYDTTFARKEVMRNAWNHDGELAKSREKPRDISKVDCDVC